MSHEWPSIFLSALASGLLSLVISHIYYRVNLAGAERHHNTQMEALEKRHAEQLLVVRTTLLAVERDSGVEAARDQDGKLTGGLHHDGKFIAAPDVSPSAAAEHLPSSPRDEDDAK